MFCMSCGMQLPDGAKYCMKCGVFLGETYNEEKDKMESSSTTKLVPAKCTSCGANLEVDASQETAICSFCNASYIVEKAISNYNISLNGNLNIKNATINVNGIDIDNLILRAKEFELDCKYEMAIDYYNQVLDADISKQEAHAGIDRINNIINDYVYFESPANRLFTAGKLQLKKGRLLFTDKKGKTTVYELRWLKKPQLISGGFSFTYGETPSGISFICKDKGPEWIKVISNALSGIYPAMYNPQSNGIDNYIRNNFNIKTKVLAIKYYRDMTGASFTEAKSKVDEIL